MILLLSGASETARALIVDNILDDHKDWRHLALEDLREDGDWSDTEDIGMEEIFGTMIACDCAREVQMEGCHIIITCPSVHLIETVRSSFSDATTIHMGDQKDCDETFSHILSPKKHSVKDTCSFLESLIAN
tara:strand:+ start:467 stop:862 length:396 start_codon:yes stop_codon:yes gene_type:complete